MLPKRGAASKRGQSIIVAMAKADSSGVKTEQQKIVHRQNYHGLAKIKSPDTQANTRAHTFVPGEWSTLG